MGKKKTIDKNLIIGDLSPKHLKELSYPELDVVCEEIRSQIIKATSESGGHLSPNLGTVELTVALHRCFDFKTDKLLFDVGHQCYAHKIITGRKLDGITTKSGVSGFQSRKESEYDVYDAGHSSTSISAAEAFAIARDNKGENYDVVCLIGDSSIVNGLSFEALNDLGSRGHKVIIVLNDNDMSISPPVGGMSNFFRRISTGVGYNKFKTKRKERSHQSKFSAAFYRFGSRIKRWFKSFLISSTIFDDMGYTYVGPVDGHDIKAIEKAIKRAKNATKSVVLHCITTKGKGYKFSENDKTGSWHGVGPFDIETGKSKCSHEGKMNWSGLFANYIHESMADEKNYLLVPATAKGSGLEDSFNDYKERCLDVGIAEEHALTLAGSLALNGYHPIVSIYSTFLQRAYDELAQDCARAGIGMSLLIDRAGLVGGNGATHQGIYDVAYLKSIPNVIITMAATPEEAAALYKQSLKSDKVFAIRYPNAYFEEKEIQPVELEYGRWRIYRPSKEKKRALIVLGPACEVIREHYLEDKNDFALINPIYLNLFDDNDISYLKGFEEILIIDEYGIKEGFVSSLESLLLEKGFEGKITSKCIPNEFIQYGKLSEQLEELKFSPKDIFDEIDKFIKIN